MQSRPPNPPNKEWLGFCERSKGAKRSAGSSRHITTREGILLINVMTGPLQNLQGPFHILLFDQ
jgi:hypothetical protein